MSEVPKDSTPLSKCEDSQCGDYLSYFVEMVQELFSKDGNFLFPFPELDSESCRNGAENDVSWRRPPMLFEKGMVYNISGYRRERLNGFLNESKDLIKSDTDEMVDYIMAINRIDTFFQKYEDTGQNQKQISRLMKAQFVLGASDPKSSASFKKVHSRFQRFLREGMGYKEAVDKLRNEILTKLGKLKLHLEEYLDVLISKNRPMTVAEKQQLGQEIQKLPKGALGRVAEIIQRRMIPEAQPTAKIINVDLAEVDNATLWRLYTFVQAVASGGNSH